MQRRLVLTIPLRIRIAVGYMFFLIIVLGAIAFSLLTAVGANLQSEADDSLILRASYIQAQLERDGAHELTQETAERVLGNLASLDEFSMPGIYIQMIDSQGRSLAASPNLPGGSLPVPSSFLTSAGSDTNGFFDVPAGQERLRLLVTPLHTSEGPSGYLLVAESMHLQDAALRQLSQLWTFAAVGSALSALAGAWYLTHRTLTPIVDLTRLARRIATTGRFDQRLAVPHVRDEVEELAATFNDMIGRLEATFRHQRDFLADASHELRGPLMVIRGNLDLLNLDLKPEDRAVCIKEATDEVERMSRLVADLLFLSEADAQQNVAHEPVPLNEVLRSVHDRLVDIDDGAHTLSLPRNDETIVLGDRQRLEQLFWNLGENALRYTPEGGRITLSLQRQGDIAETKVTDSGVGIAAEHLPRIFDRFYRVDRSRSRQQGGTGLGLAIVKQVVEAHGGQVRVKSEPGQGSTFSVVLPVFLPNGSPEFHHTVSHASS